MADLTVTCSRCGCELTHVCNGDLRQAVIDLMTWQTYCGMSDAVIREAKKNGMYSKGDEEAPFVSEAFLYSLLGKEDARTFMSLINNVLRCAGVDPHSSDLYGATNDVIKGREERKRLAEQRRKTWEENKKKANKKGKKA